MRVTNGIPLGCSLILQVDTVNHVETLKARFYYPVGTRAEDLATHHWHGLCTVRVFRQKSTLKDAIGSHACLLEAYMRVSNGIPLGCPLFLPVHTVNCVQTLKVPPTDRRSVAAPRAIAFA
jgi:hypothetical protein